MPFSLMTGRTRLDMGRWLRKLSLTRVRSLVAENSGTGGARRFLLSECFAGKVGEGALVDARERCDRPGLSLDSWSSPSLENYCSS